MRDIYTQYRPACALALLISAVLIAAQPGRAADIAAARASASAAPAGSSVSGPLSGDSPMDAGYRDMYNLEFDAAHRSFQLCEKRNPGDPLGPASEAAADLFSEFNRMHVLESDLFMDDDRFFYQHVPSPDPAVKTRFESEIARAERLADASLARVPRDRNALLAKVLDAGMESDYAALIENRYFASLSDMKRSGHLAEALLAADPSCYDAYLAIGIENYILSLNPAPVRWLLQLYGAQTDPRAGIAKLELTAAKGHYLEPFARVLLAVAALRAHDEDRARNLLRGLVQEFPQNRLYARELARIN
jgi:hypothetical protein